MSFVKAPTHACSEMKGRAGAAGTPAPSVMVMGYDSGATLDQ